MNGDKWTFDGGQMDVELKLDEGRMKQLNGKIVGRHDGRAT